MSWKFNLAISRLYGVGRCSTSSAARGVLSQRRQMDILDSHISYLDTREGDNTVVFLHGNITSSYLWKNVIPHVRNVARCVAPDLIGMGHSGKPDIQYRFVDHYRYLSTWIEEMDFPSKLTFVGHGWGALLAFHWCYQHQANVRSIAHIESGITGPIPSLDPFPPEVRRMAQTVCSDAGEELVIKQNILMEEILPRMVSRQLSDEEIAEYRAPFIEEKHRKPLLRFVREDPIVGEGPDDVIKIAQDFNQWLLSSHMVPKLYIDVEPGMVGITCIFREEASRLPNQKVVKIKGLHMIQEDSPDEIGGIIRSFLTDLFQNE